MRENALSEMETCSCDRSAFVAGRYTLARNDGYLSRDMFQIWPGTFGNRILVLEVALLDQLATGHTSAIRARKLLAHATQ